MSQVHYLLLLCERGDKAAFVCGSVGDGMNHHVAAEEFYHWLRKRGKETGSQRVLHF